MNECREEGVVLLGLPLEGIRVLDLSRYLPGPFCSQILADFGAEVIKVENPEGGDLGRWLPPRIEGESARFYTVNRNKKSITLDLRREEGQAIFKRLVAKSDVVLEQFRAGVMEKLGLSYEELRKVNKRIIYCALTGYGLTGPLRHAAGHELNFMSLSGVLQLNRTGAGAPTMAGAPGVDVGGGSLYAVIAILLALASREKTGEGQLCDIAILDGAISNLAYVLGEWSGQDGETEKDDNLQAGGYACYNIYQTKDNKYVTLAAVEEKFWNRFCEIMGWPEYAAAQWDASRQDEIKFAVGQVMLQKNRDEWVEFFSAEDICFTPVLSLEEMCKHPQVKTRNMVLKWSNDKGSGKEVVLPGVPVKMSGTPARTNLVFPRLGQHTEEILQALGYTTLEIEQFRKQRVI